MSTFKKCFLLLVSVVLSFVAVLPADAAPANNGADCIILEFPTGQPDGTILERWPAAETGNACLKIHFSKPGKFVIEGGWVFNSPLKLGNGTEVPTRIVNGEQAAQIDPISFNVRVGQTKTLKPTWNTNGTEIGLRWKFYQNRYKLAKMPYGNYLFKRNWTGNQGDVALLTMVFSKPGTITFRGGWTFDRNITLNGKPVETFRKTGEKAFQIKRFTMQISVGDELVWKQRMIDGNAELGLYIKFTK